MTLSHLPSGSFTRSLIGLLALVSISACKPSTTVSVPTEYADSIAAQDDYYYELQADLEAGEISQAEFDAEVISLAEWKEGAK